MRLLQYIFVDLILILDLACMTRFNIRDNVNKHTHMTKRHKRDNESDELTNVLN